MSLNAFSAYISAERADITCADCAYTLGDKADITCASSDDKADISSGSHSLADISADKVNKADITCDISSDSSGDRADKVGIKLIQLILHVIFLLIVLMIELIFFWV